MITVYQWSTPAGIPAPELKWWKDGREIADDDRHVIHVLLSHGQTLSLAEFWYQLTIINVQVGLLHLINTVVVHSRVN